MIHPAQLIISNFKDSSFKAYLPPCCSFCALQLTNPTKKRVKKPVKFGSKGSNILLALNVFKKVVKALSILRFRDITDVLLSMIYLNYVRESLKIRNKQI